MRNILAERIVRGKVELLIYTESVGIETTVSLNIPLMAAYKEQGRGNGTSVGNSMARRLV